MTAQQWTLRALHQDDLASIVTSCWCDIPIVQALDKIRHVLRDVGRNRCWVVVVIWIPAWGLRRCERAIPHENMLYMRYPLVQAVFS